MSETNKIPPPSDAAFREKLDLLLYWTHECGMGAARRGQAADHALRSRAVHLAAVEEAHRREVEAVKRALIPEAIACLIDDLRRERDEARAERDRAQERAEAWEVERDRIRAVTGEVFSALVKAGPAFGDLARVDLAHAIDALAHARAAAESSAERLRVEVEAVARREEILTLALLALRRVRCPACGGTRCEDRCWLAAIIEGKAGPTYETACEAVREGANESRTQPGPAGGQGAEMKPGVKLIRNPGSKDSPTAKDLRAAIAEVDRALDRAAKGKRTEAMNTVFRSLYGKKIPVRFTDRQLRAIAAMCEASIPDVVYPEVIAVMQTIRRHFGVAPGAHYWLAEFEAEARARKKLE